MLFGAFVAMVFSSVMGMVPQILISILRGGMFVGLITVLAAKLSAADPGSGSIAGKQDRGTRDDRLRHTSLHGPAEEG